MKSERNALAIDQTGKPADAVTRAYLAHGAVLITDFFSANRVAEMRVEAERLLEQYRAGKLNEARIAYRPTVTGGKTFERIDPVCDIAPIFAALSLDARLLALAADLIGGEPFLFKDKLLYKFGGDAGYGLHQDYPYYNLSETLKFRVVTFAVAIDGVSQGDGGLRFVLERHDKVQPTPKKSPKDCDEAALADAPHWDARTGPGSLIAFHTLTPHSSGPNRTAAARRMIYLTYIDKEASHLRSQYYNARVAQSVSRT